MYIAAPNDHTSEVKMTVNTGARTYIDILLLYSIEVTGCLLCPNIALYLAIPCKTQSSVTVLFLNSPKLKGTLLILCYHYCYGYYLSHVKLPNLHISAIKGAE